VTNITNDKLIVTDQFDQEMRLFADRHYSRSASSVGKARFIPGCRNLVIRNVAGTVLFTWTYPRAELRQDNQTGYICVTFRNESPQRSSDIILECEALAIQKWGPNRFYTYVDLQESKVLILATFPVLFTGPFGASFS
jgi:hypothetical protein